MRVLKMAISVSNSDTYFLYLWIFFQLLCSWFLVRDSSWLCDFCRPLTLIMFYSIQMQWIKKMFRKLFLGNLIRNNSLWKIFHFKPFPEFTRVVQWVTPSTQYLQNKTRHCVAHLHIWKCEASSSLRAL